MPDLDEDSIPATAPPVPITPPRVTPATWRDCPVFAESFLMWLDEPFNSTLRAIGRALFDVLDPLLQAVHLRRGALPYDRGSGEESEYAQPDQT